jgi:arginase
MTQCWDKAHGETTMPQDISLFGVPLDLGAGRRGVDMGPSAIRYAGLAERIAGLGHRVRDEGNLMVPLAETIATPMAGERLRYLEPIVAVNQELAARVARAVGEGALPLILGGDHSIAIGSVAGSARARRLGLLWIDAHGDFNTAQTTPSGNIHGMSLAVLCGLGHPALTGLAARTPAIDPSHVAVIGARDLDPEERGLLREAGARVFTMHDIDRRGLPSVMEEAIATATGQTEGFHVSLDLDAVDPREAPGVGTPVLGGISYREAHLAMEMIAQSDGLRSLDLVEVNPILDAANATAILAVELALSCLGKRIY